MDTQVQKLLGELKKKDKSTYDYIWKRETQLVSNIDYFIIIWYNIAKGERT